MSTYDKAAYERNKHKISIREGGKFCGLDLNDAYFVFTTLAIVLIFQGKYCSKGNHILPLSKFPKNACYPDGHAYYCKNCKNTNYLPNKVRQAEYYLENQEHIINKSKKYYQANKPKVFARHKQRMKNDPEYNLANKIRSGVWKILKQKGTYNTNKLIKLIGCGDKELKSHLESQFKPGMSWENHGSQWHVDHIRPLSRFNLLNPDELKIACNYKNLQPLWANENIKKGNKI